MSNLRSTVRSMIDSAEASSPVDVYAVAEALQESFPEKDVRELVKIVSDVAVRQPGRSLVWERRQR